MATFKFSKLPGDFSNVREYILAKRAAEAQFRADNKATAQERAKDARGVKLAHVINLLHIADGVDAVLDEMKAAEVPIVTSDEVCLMVESTMTKAERENADLRPAICHYLSTCERVTGVVGRGGGYKILS